MSQKQSLLREKLGTVAGKDSKHWIFIIPQDMSSECVGYFLDIVKQFFLPGSAVCDGPDSNKWLMSTSKETHTYRYIPLQVALSSVIITLCNEFSRWITYTETCGSCHRMCNTIRTDRDHISRQTENQKLLQWSADIKPGGWSHVQRGNQKHRSVLYVIINSDRAASYYHTTSHVMMKSDILSFVISAVHK